MPETPVVLDDLPKPVLAKPNPCWEHARAHAGRWIQTDLSVASVGKLRVRHNPDGFEVAQRNGTVYVRWHDPDAASRAARAARAKAGAR